MFLSQLVCGRGLAPDRNGLKAAAAKDDLSRGPPTYDAWLSLSQFLYWLFQEKKFFKKWLYSY